MHVLCITEHWANDLEINYINIPNFTLVSSFCRVSKGHGGVAIYVCDNIRAYTPKNIKYMKSFVDESNIELCAISLCIHYKKVNIITVYRPPNGNIHTFFLNLSQSLQFISKNNNPQIILCGDLNIDSLKNSAEKDILLDTLELFNLTPCLNEPTRVAINKNNDISKTAIDYIATNLPYNTYDAYIVNPSISDHFAQIICCNTVNSTDNLSKNYIHVRQYTTENIAKFSYLLNRESWDSIFTDNLEVSFENFIKLFLKCLDVSCPLVTRLIKNGSTYNSKNWITPELIQKGNDLKNLYWLATELNDPNVFITYKKKKKQYNELIKNSKKEFFSSNINSKLNSSKEIWSLVNSQIGNKNFTDNLVIKINNAPETDPGTIAEHFGQYFSSIADKKVAEHFKNNISQQSTTCNQVNHSIFLKPTSPSEVRDIINGLKNTNAVGVDGISTKALKYAGEVIAEPLACLINKCFQQGYFPSIFKIAIVLPIYKKGDKQDSENYRPISLLCVISKVIERLILNRIMDFLTRFNLLSKFQHGFQQNKSTESATLQLLQFLYSEIDKGYHVVGLFFDLSKAFDTLNIDFILYKLERLGIRGLALKLIHSFLMDRKIQVKISNHLSDEYNLDMGVPQGSVLGPLIFLLFINDLPNKIQNGQIVMFADDTTMLLSAPDSNELKIKISNILQSYEEWCHKNILILNIGKTECLFFSKRRIPSNDLALALPNDGFSKSVKFLGTIIDDSLCWDLQVNQVCTKLKQAYYAMRQLKGILCNEALLSVYYALAYSHLTYNIVAWGCASKINRVFILQKRLIRLLYNIGPRESCRQHFVDNKILTVASIYILNIIKYVKRNIHDFKLNSDNHSYNTRYGETLSITYHKTATYEKSPQYKGIQLYNKLPIEIKDVKCQKKFNTCLKLFLSSKCFYSIEEYMNHSL